MSDGVYVLVTKDGFRVAYSNKYDDFFHGFDDELVNYTPNSAILLKTFGTSEVFPDEESVLRAAFSISKTVDETDDGIMFVNNYPDLTFEELTSGNTA